MVLQADLQTSTGCPLLREKSGNYVKRSGILEIFKSQGIESHVLFNPLKNWTNGYKMTTLTVFG